MVISTSSYNLQLTDDICEYVESTLRNQLGDNADDIQSVDARIEAIHTIRNRFDTKAVVRVDLRNHRTFITEIQDKNLHAAVRRSAADSARAIDRQLRRSRQVTGQQLPGKFQAFAR